MEKELIENARSNIYPFHMPGHKRCRMDQINPYDIDITEIEGFDNLHHAEGIIKIAQTEAAELYEADHSYFLINGSTCGILAAISAATDRGDKILVARNCHKAVYHGIYLRQLKPVYIYPDITRAGIQGQIRPDEIEKALNQDPDIKAVFITSPTYDGVVSDIETISEIVHKRKIPLIVDEAHGAHFGFGGGFPQNATKLGADAVILSLHKTLPAFTQTALLNICGTYIDHRKIEKFLGIYETSSPSYVLMSGIERCIHYIRENGERPFKELRNDLDEFYSKTKLKNLRLVKKEDFSMDEAYDFDESKILIFTDNAGMSGQVLLEKLLGEYQIQLEMASGNYALALCSIMDTKKGFDRLSYALMDIDKKISVNKNSVKTGSYVDNLSPKTASGGEVKLKADMYQTLSKNMEICDAYEKRCILTRLSEAAGKTSGVFVYLYPPGIPLAVPGEIINQKLVDDISYAFGMGIEVDGITVGDTDGTLYIEAF